MIHEPVAVINAGDFYGGHAYELLAAHLSSVAPYCMVGYALGNTLTPHGSADRWCGVTYREDHEAVVARLRELKKNGIYPKYLNKI